MPEYDIENETNQPDGFAFISFEIIDSFHTELETENFV